MWINYFQTICLLYVIVKSRLYRCHLFNVSSSPLDDCGHGSAHPSILPDSRLLHQGSPHVVSHCGPGGRHRGDTLRRCPSSRLPDFLTAPQAPGRDQAQQVVSDGDPEQRLDSVIFLKSPSLWTLIAEECQAQQSTSHWTKGPGVSSGPSGPVVDPLLTQTLVNAWFKSLN